jgi:hypothetical protein
MPDRNPTQCMYQLKKASYLENANNQFTPLEIIYNNIHPSIKLHLKEKSTQLLTIHLVQEIKRDIIYRRMNTNANQQARNLTRIRAHLLSTIKKTISLFEYQGTRNLQESINFFNPP